MGENWSELSNFIENSNLNDKEYILDVINNNNLTSEDKKTILYNLDNGFVNNYLRKNLYWKLRNSSAIILWNRTKLPACKSGEIFNVPVVSNILKDDFYISKEFNPITNIIYKPLFALKTNLLFDVITALNVEVEVPIKNRFSIAAEWIFPFWKNHSSELTFQTLYGGVDFKYWFGNRDDKDVMTGWFCDIYGGYGKFDYQLFQKNGAQGKILNIGAGVGYAHKIAKNLRMEYALGVGLIRADYHKYDMVYDTEYGDIKVVRYPWKKFIYNWIGPTKAKVSLVWLINSKSVRNK